MITRNYKTLLLAIFLPVTMLSAQKTDFRSLYEEVCDTVANHFLDQQFIENKFPALRAEYGKDIQQFTNHSDFTNHLNQLLSSLNTSHTHYYTADEPSYYQIADIFSAIPVIKAQFDADSIRYPSLGFYTQTIDDQLFVSGILEGGPADQAGLKTGDEIIEVDGEKHWPVKDLLKKTGERILLTFRRTKDGNIRSIFLEPQLINPSQEFLRAQRESIWVDTIKEKKVGYIHIWSYAGQHFQDLLVAEIAWGRLKEADVLIYDIRGGWGGAAPDYLNIFNKNIPTLNMVSAKGDTLIFDRQWRKPVVMLIDRGSRSGKEVLAYGFKKNKIGPVVGEKTAGAVVAGRVFPMSDGSMLYLAVSDVLVDGVRIEGIGVKPDIEVPRILPYSAGKDPQLERAIEEALNLLH